MNCKRIVFSMAFVSLALAGQAQACKQFRLDEVKLLPSRFQENMKRDSAWIASIDVNRLLHSFRNTAGVFSSKEGGYMTVKKLGECRNYEIFGNEDSRKAAELSDPKKYNDYYTFDYGKHKEVEYNSLKDFRQTSPLHFESTDGTRLEPLYNLHHCRYAVYLRKK